MGDKENFQSGIEQQLRQWNTQIERAAQTIADLKANASQLESDAKHQNLEHIQDLERKITAAKAKIDEGQQRLASFKAAGKEAWDEVKTGSQEAWDTLKTSVEEASSKIKDRIPKK